MKEPADCMTSELVGDSNALTDKLGQEFTRRLSLIQLTPEQIQHLFAREKGILTSRNGLGEAFWARRYFITELSTPETMPEVESMTFSEMIMITDDANSGFCRDHHVLGEKAWAALCIAASAATYTEARYVKTLQEKAREYGWSEPQIGAFIRNECLLTERLKWEYHAKPAWTEESTNLVQYQR